MNQPTEQPSKLAKMIGTAVAPAVIILAIAVAVGAAFALVVGVFRALTNL